VRKNRIERLAELGQSVWYDYIRRDLFDGELDRLVRRGLRGMTSNPTIFEKAITETALYDDSIAVLSAEPPERAFEALALEDIRAAADAFRGVYDATRGVDGRVSIEVAPSFAHDTEGSIAEARRLWALAARPNVMIKLPGTREGLPAIRQCLAEGIPINITLLFSTERYQGVVEAYLGALEQRLAAGEPIDEICSVASFFVSRVDTNVDAKLDAIVADASRAQYDQTLARSLRSRAGVANATIAYDIFQRMFRGDARYRRLQDHGAKIQRPLWASTSTKDPTLPELHYVEALVAPDTVDTMPPATFAAYQANGDPHVRLRDELAGARELTRSLRSLGIDLEEVANELEDEGVAKFSKSFDRAVEAVRGKQEALRLARTG
jgi:transaldolase